MEMERKIMLNLCKNLTNFITENYKGKMIDLNVFLPTIRLMCYINFNIASSGPWILSLFGA